MAEKKAIHMDSKLHFNEEKLEAARPSSEKPPEGFSRGELAGLMLAGALLLYSLTQADIPAVFLTASFILFEMRLPARALGDTVGRSLAGVLQGLSLSLFFGAVLMLFF